MAEETNGTSLPDPNGQPEPVKEESGFNWWEMGKHMAIVAGGVAGGMVLVFTFMVPTHTSGATRSSKLQMEERRAEIAATMAEAAATKTADHE